MIERKALSKDNIAHRAYELYTQRGCEPGKDIEDWVRAEKELASEVARKNEGRLDGRNQNNLTSQKPCPTKDRAVVSQADDLDFRPYAQT